MLERAFLALVLLGLPSLAMACPTCKDALGENPEGLGFARGIYLTVILMLGVLFTAVGIFIYKIARQSTPASDQATAAQPKV